MLQTSTANGLIIVEGTLSRLLSIALLLARPVQLDPPSALCRGWPAGCQTVHSGGPPAMRRR